MAKKRRRQKPRRSKPGPPVIRNGRAEPHGELIDNRVHIFVDDQNLFFGIVNQKYGPEFRIDFGRLLNVVYQASNGDGRFIQSAYIAGVIPDDDSFWKIAENRGFTVRRGFLGANQRSKQDDAYLITDLTATLFEQDGPSTIILVAGDADYVPPLIKAIEKGWRVEVVFIDRGVSGALEAVTHEFRELNPYSIEYIPGLS